MQTKKSVSFKDSIIVGGEKALGVHNSPAAYQKRAAVTHQSGQSIEETVLVEGIVLVHSPIGS